MRPYCVFAIRNGIQDMRSRLITGVLAAVALSLTIADAPMPAAEKSSAGGFEWRTATPESQGMSSERLEAFRKDLAARRAHSLLVIRNDRIVYEWYDPGYSVKRKHYIASMSKAVVGGMATAVGPH